MSEPMAVRAMVPTQQLAATRCDPGLPPAGPRVGGLHPVAAMVERITEVFVPLGFEVHELPLLETEEVNFDLLGYPSDHPTRTRLTFFPAEGVVMRTHASSGTLPVLRRHAPGPVRALLVATCFRNELASPVSLPQLTQIDGLVVQPGLGLPDLMGFFQRLVEGLFGVGHPWWPKRSAYPFNAPGFALDILCPLCRGESAGGGPSGGSPRAGSAEGDEAGQGCGECRGGRVEIGAGGLLRSEVLAEGGHDPERVSAVSFGCSVERLLKLFYGFEDIRQLLVNDSRVLQQFN